MRSLYAVLIFQYRAGLTSVEAGLPLFLVSIPYRCSDRGESIHAAKSSIGNGRMFVLCLYCFLLIKEWKRVKRYTDP